MTKWFNEIIYDNLNGNFDESEIVSEESNLSFFNVIFSLKHFLIYHIYHKIV